MKEYVLYHFTRGFKDDILKNGLRKLNIREQSKYVYSKIPKEKQYLFKVLLRNPKLDNTQHNVRNGFICLTTVKQDSGVSDLIGYFGGEYIRRIFEFKKKNDVDRVKEILSKIGAPLRIKVRIPEKYLNKYSIQMLKSRKNNDVDVFVVKNIEKERIISIDDHLVDYNVF